MKKSRTQRPPVKKSSLQRPRWSIEALSVPAAKVNRLRQKLLRELARRGETLESIGKRTGIKDKESLYKLPLIGVQTAAWFLEVTRQRTNRYVATHQLGTRIDGQNHFSIDELVAFKLTPRESGRPKGS